jgi:hypothetical protein
MANQTFNAKKYTLHDCSNDIWKFEGNYILTIDSVFGYEDGNDNEIFQDLTKFTFTEETTSPDSTLPTVNPFGVYAYNTFVKEPYDVNLSASQYTTEFLGDQDCKKNTGPNCDCDAVSLPPECESCCAWQSENCGDETGLWWTWEKSTISECSWEGEPEEYENWPNPESFLNRFKTNQKFPPTIGNQDEGEQVTSEEQTYYNGCLRFRVQLCETCGHTDNTGLQDVDMGTGQLDGEHQFTAPLSGASEKQLCCGEFLGCKDNICQKGYSESEYHPCIEEGAECFPPTNLPVIGGDPHVTTFFGEKFDM